MSGKFSSFEKNLIDELITSLKNDLKSKKISFEYEVVDHGRFLGEKTLNVFGLISSTL